MSDIAQRVETVKLLKKEARFSEAITILEGWIVEEETHSTRTGMGVAPWPYEQLAIIHRKCRECSKELAVLERFAHQHHAPGASVSVLKERLMKAYELAGLIELRESDGKTTAFHKLKQVPVAHQDIFRRTCAVVDVETTGLSSADELVEIGAILFRYSALSGEVLEVVGEYSGLREPTCRMDPEAQAVHGIGMDELRGRTLDHATLKALLGQADAIFAHNASFDRRYIAKLYPELAGKPWICTMNGIPWRSQGQPSKALASLLDSHGIPRAHAHRALDDARAVLQLIASRAPSANEPYLVQLASTPPVGPDFADDVRERRSSHRTNGRFKLDDDKPEKSGCLSVLLVLFGVVGVLLMLALMR